MDRDTKILISGAGIAGLTCATWLGRQGFKPVVIEKSPVIRADGYIISLSHASYQFAQELDLLDKIAAKNAGIRQSSYHDRKGRAMLTLDYEKLFNGIDVVQIMRDDLQTILYDAAREYTDIRLGTTIESMSNQDEGAHVLFSDHSTEQFDVVIGADGLHSNTRSLNFRDNEITKHYLGLYSSAYRLPNVLGLAHSFENHMEQSRYMCVYTTRDDDLACVFIWHEEERFTPTPEERYGELRIQYQGAPETVKRVLDAFPHGQTVYMDPLTQIEMSSWSRGSVVLLGDAAHCLTLLSGQGASSAFWGACSLARALCTMEKVPAFKAYEAELMPVISEIQPATRLSAKWYVPRSEGRYFARDAAMRFLPNAFYQRYFKHKYSKA